MLSLKTSWRVRTLATRISSEYTLDLGLSYPDPGVRKKILTKILAGAVWEKRLVEFVQVFMKRRKEFELALTMIFLRSLLKMNRWTLNIP